LARFIIINRENGFSCSSARRVIADIDTFHLPLQRLAYEYSAWSALSCRSLRHADNKCSSVFCMDVQFRS
jgi:hypothetical protein